MESVSKPLGISGKQLLPNRDISGQAPSRPSRMAPSVSGFILFKVVSVRVCSL